MAPKIVGKDRTWSGARFTAAWMEAGLPYHHRGRTRWWQQFKSRSSIGKRMEAINYEGHHEEGCARCAKEIATGVPWLQVLLYAALELCCPDPFGTAIDKIREGEQ